MNAFAFSSMLTGVLSLLLSLFVITRRRNLKLNRLWALTSLCVALWSFGLFGVTFFNNFKYAYLSQVVLDISAIFLPVLFLHFVFLLLERKSFGLAIKFFYILSFLLAIFSLTSYFKKGLIPVFNFKYWIDPGPFYIIFPLFFLALATVSVSLLIKYQKKFSGIKRQQIKYVLYCAFIGFGGGIFNFLPQFSQIYPIGNYLVGLYTISITYAIIKYRLMNIRLILTRSILYGVLVGAVAAFFALSVLVVGEMIGGNTRTSKIITYVINSFIVVVFLEPIKQVWAKITDKIFYKDKVDYQQVLQEASSVLAKEIDLEKLLRETAIFLADRLKIKEVSVLATSNGDFHMIASSNPHKSVFTVSQDFISYLNQGEKMVVIEELIRNLSDSGDSDNQDQIKKFINEAETLQVEMIVPIIEQAKLNAIFIFSAKQSGDLYDQNDINFFNVFSPQIATAIEKSKLYEEVEEFNRELQAKVEERTKSLKEANVGLEERNKFLATIQAVTNLINRTLDLKQVNQMIADSIARELSYVGGILSFIDHDKQVLRVGAITNTTESKKALALLPQDPRKYETVLTSDYNLGAKTVLSGKINFSDRMSDFLSPPVDRKIIDQVQDRLGVQTVVGVPIFSEARIIGIIHFLLSVKRDKISSMDLETMTALTNQVGITSRNLKLYNTLQQANQELQDANMRLRELDKAKSEFLSIASHQLRTPISAIKGYLSMIMEGDFGKIPDPINKIVRDLFESASRLARLINVFLNVSRIESGRLKLEKKPLQITELITSVIEELKNEATKKELKLTFKESKKKVPQILADADKLREVILNLIDNSIKYTPQGSVDVSLDFDKKNLTFMVEDTGIGIKEDEVKSLFRKFVRGSGVAQIHTGGSGLGLFIAQKIIKEHGGEVWAESDGPGKGSRFKFVIPLYDEKAVQNGLENKE
ncbi:hypothetical protein C4566_03385 [Candidatus Parcubacteria bacterium]|nr:MAG: hypothetical protein C4566_03385 [Candidatus Parcubacteria bacterium]